MKIPLSDRLKACCSFVHPGDRVADIGCDHGYLGIYLLKNGIASSVIASDVNEGPLHSAVFNAKKFDVSDRMAFFLSDGTANIPRNFDCMVCAGMGADTIISILDAAPWLKQDGYRLILQCQSKRPELRRYLSREGYAIISETLAKDGKFIYPIMEVVYAPGQICSEKDCYLSPALLRCGSPLLGEFIQRVIDGVEASVNGLSRSGGEKYEAYAALLEALKGEANGNCQ